MFLSESYTLAHLSESYTLAYLSENYTLAYLSDQFNKMKNKAFHTVVIIPKSNIKIVERGKIDTRNTQLHAAPIKRIITL